MESSGMGQHADDTIDHQDEVEAVAEGVAEDVVEEAVAEGGVVEEAVETAVEAELEDASSQAAVTDVVALTGGESPTEAEHNALVTRVNLLTQVLRDANLIPTA